MTPTGDAYASIGARRTTGQYHHHGTPPVSTTRSKAISHDAGGPKAATSARPLSGVNFEVVGGHLAAFPVGYQFEVHFLAFTQITQSGALHGTDMNKSVRPTLIGCAGMTSLSRVVSRRCQAVARNWIPSRV
jgi:hypothetical protein